MRSCTRAPGSGRNAADPRSAGDRAPRFGVWGAVGEGSDRAATPAAPVASSSRREIIDGLLCARARSDTGCGKRIASPRGRRQGESAGPQRTGSWMCRASWAAATRWARRSPRRPMVPSDARPRARDRSGRECSGHTPRAVAPPGTLAAPAGRPAASAGPRAARRDPSPARSPVTQLEALHHALLDEQDRRRRSRRTAAMASKIPSTMRGRGPGTARRAGAGRGAP